MSDYKLAAAKACLSYIKSGQTIGLGAGSTMANLIDLVSEDPILARYVTFVSSSFKTRSHLQQKGLTVQTAAQISGLDIYFDGCDQFDVELNALKSGGGIHTSEKILAAMAKEFIIAGDDSKFALSLDGSYPLVIEILPEALPYVCHVITVKYPKVVFTLRTSTQKDGALISENGNMLADLRFPEFHDLAKLNIDIKMIPGIVEHSLFYRMASRAIISGQHGTRIIMPKH